VVIAFHVNADRVNIIGIFYGGQDYETALQEDEDEARDSLLRFGLPGSCGGGGSWPPRFGSASVNRSKKVILDWRSGGAVHGT